MRALQLCSTGMQLAAQGAHPRGTERPDEPRQAKDEHPEHDEEGAAHVEHEVHCEFHDDVYELAVSLEDDCKDAIDKRVALANDFGPLKAVPAKCITWP